ncbi:toluene-4-monooxygenase system B family protein [Mycolicibacterium sp.]|uniref:toluene-4-monooxygenase system B family protein n=1 Tax=Mycolicibacterium sp. TaxID=2320850 RepID=UPI0037C70712
MALLPLQAVFDGDFVLLLVPVDDEEPMSSVAEKVAYHVVDHRVQAEDRPLTVRFDGKSLASDATAAGSGIGPLDVIQVGYA